MNVIPKFVSIAPVSLTKYREHNISMHCLRYSMFNDNMLQEQQNQLEHDICLVNNIISELNQFVPVTNVRWDRDACKSSIKRRGRHHQNHKKVVKCVYDKFYDGCHPNNVLANIWFKRLCTSVHHDIFADYSPLDSDDETEENSWDFK